jgi:hypothetical protein
MPIAKGLSHLKSIASLPGVQSKPPRNRLSMVL